MARKLLIVASLAALTTPAAASAEVCTAFVNFAGGKGGYMVVEVDAGATPAAKAARGGLSVGAAGARTDLSVAAKTRHQKGAHGDLDETWGVVTAVTAGKSRVWLDRDPKCPVPDEDAVAPFNCSHDVQVSAVVGPFVSLLLPTGGFTGGVHGYDDSTVTTLRAPLGQPVHAGYLLLQQLGSDAALRAVERLTGDDALDPPPDVSVEGLRQAGLALGDDGLHLVGLPECCSWAQNHGMWDMDVPLPKTPAPLQEWAPRAGAWPGPKGCADVRVKGGAILVVRDGKETKVAAAPPGKLLGVSWLGAVPQVDEAAAAKALEEARAAVKGKRFTDAAAAFERALDAKPGDAGVLAERGWALFLAGDPAGATTASWQALSLTDDPKRQGAIYYNLGRIREEKGDVDGAREMYGRSLVVRPGNETVKARLQATYQ